MVSCGGPPSNPASTNTIQIGVNGTPGEEISPSQPVSTDVLSAGITETIPLENLLATEAPDFPPTAALPAAAIAGPCLDGLAYMGDLTYPDKGKVLPGQPLEKQWKVRNSGSCDWGPDYRFRWINGSLPSDQAEEALYPAVAGSEAVITIHLTAPIAAGEYVAWWQAISPGGMPFGEMLSIDVIVTQ